MSAFNVYKSKFWSQPDSLENFSVKSCSSHLTQMSSSAVKIVMHRVGNGEWGGKKSFPALVHTLRYYLHHSTGYLTHCKHILSLKDNTISPMTTWRIHLFGRQTHSFTHSRANFAQIRATTGQWQEVKYLLLAATLPIITISCSSVVEIVIIVLVDIKDTCHSLWSI